MICGYCGYEDNGLNPFSKCLRCGQPFDSMKDQVHSERPVSDLPRVGNPSE